jgi:hypothetical protein
MSWDPAKQTVLTINSAFIDENLSDFPIVVTVSSGVGINDFDLSAVLTELAYADRKKMAFFAGGDQFSGSQCYVEIENWDASLGILHVQVPTVSSGTDTQIHFYYDSSQAENLTYIGDLDESPAKSVWDSDFEAVYHMNQDPTAAGGNEIKDSTSNLNHGSTTGTMNSGDLQPGKIGDCIEFDGSNDNVNLGNIQGGLTEFTWELIVSSTQSIDDANYYQLPVMIGTIQGSGSSNDALFCVKAGDVAWYDEWGGGGTDTNQSISDGEWYHLVITRNGTDINIYKNGDNIADISTGTNGLNANGLRICGAHWTANRYFGGFVEEVRISNAERTAAWVKATYHSTFDTLITFSQGAGYYFDGYVTESSVGVIRTVRAHRRDSGEVMFTTTSSGVGGYFYGETIYGGEHYVVVLDDDAGASYNLLAYDNVLPTTISG